MMNLSPLMIRQTTPSAAIDLAKACEPFLGDPSRHVFLGKVGGDQLLILDFHEVREETRLELRPKLLGLSLKTKRPASLNQWHEAARQWLKMESLTQVELARLIPKTNI